MGHSGQKICLRLIGRMDLHRLPLLFAAQHIKPPHIVHQQHTHTDGDCHRVKPSLFLCEIVLMKGYRRNDRTNQYIHNNDLFSHSS
jgi:hypothetical protein